jgi:hypothetical protein
VDTETLCTPLKHPLRARMLEVANQRPISSTQFVKEGLAPPGVEFKDLQHGVSHVAYHFRELEKARCVEVVDEVKRRGAHEIMYRGVKALYFTDEQFATLTQKEREKLSRVSFRGLIARAESAQRAKTFDGRADRHLTWLPLTLDQAGWAVLMADLDAFFKHVKRLGQEAKERVDASGEKGIDVTWGLVGFESPSAEVAAEVEDPPV